MYQFFENVVEKCVDSCASVWIKLRSQSEDVLFCMEIESETNLACFSEMAQSCSCEDGIWRFVFTVERQVNRNADIFDAGNIIKSRGEFDLASCFPRYED